MWEWTIHAIALALKQLKPKNDSGLVAEVALVVVAACEIIAETSQHIIDLCRSDRNVRTNLNVNSSANDEVKGIVAGTFRYDAAYTIVEYVSIKIRMGSAKQSFDERRDGPSVELDLWTHVVGEEITRGSSGAPAWADNAACRKDKGFGAATI